MLTMFSIPKPFHGHIKVIQTNAIRSWTLLHPRPEIILVGDDEGTAEVAKELGLRHVPEVECNEYGTPLVNSVFYKGQATASYPLVCYINADIILMGDFVKAVQLILDEIPGMDFLAVGRRWNVELIEPWNFENPTWERELRAHVTTHGKLDPPSSIDYFLFPKGLWEDIPPFSLGRTRWDNWFIYRARAKKVPVVDATLVATIVHQQHDYSHLPGGKIWFKKGPEAKRNWQLRGGVRGLFTVHDATHILTQEGLKRAPAMRLLAAPLIRLKGAAIYALTDTLYPYSYPLILVAKGFRLLTSNLKKMIQRKW